MSNILSFTTVNKRENNEDCCLAYTLNVYERQYTILLLSDGMGGHDYGEIISNITISSISSIINHQILTKLIRPKLESTKEVIIQEILIDAIERTNHKILQLKKSNKWKDGGATIVAVIIFDNEYYWGMLGDSRLYHLSAKEKKITQLGFDHSVPGILLRQGVIKPEVARHHAQRNELVYYIGIDKIPNRDKIEFSGQGSIQKDDMLLLFSDGLTGKINDSILQEQFDLYPNESLSNIVKQVAAANQKLGEKDNQTAIIFVNDASNQASVEEVTSLEIFNSSSPNNEELLLIGFLNKIIDAETIDIKDWEVKLNEIHQQRFIHPEITKLLDAINVRVEAKKNNDRLEKMPTAKEKTINEVFPKKNNSVNPSEAELKTNSSSSIRTFSENQDSITPVTPSDKHIPENIIKKIVETTSDEDVDVEKDEAKKTGTSSENKHPESSKNKHNKNDTNSLNK